jgi:NAD(P)-dependent dehydrogenase (short-subunit alcohol dehydrogenase family)
MTPIIAVIGASRGIGLELVGQLSQSPGATVISATRAAPSSSLPPNVKPITLDLTDDASITAAAKEVPELDTLIINAAIGLDHHLIDVSSEILLSYLNTNVVGPNRVIQAFLPALLARKTRQIVIISSTAGSMEFEKGSNFGLQGPYSVSKAAVNMLAVQWHNELSQKGFTVVPLHVSTNSRSIITSFRCLKSSFLSRHKHVSRVNNA